MVDVKSTYSYSKGEINGLISGSAITILVIAITWNLIWSINSENLVKQTTDGRYFIRAHYRYYELKSPKPMLLRREEYLKETEEKE